MSTQCLHAAAAKKRRTKRKRNETVSAVCGARVIAARSATVMQTGNAMRCNSFSYKQAAYASCSFVTGARREDATGF